MYKWEPYMMEYNSKLGEHPLCERCAATTDNFMIAVNIYKIKKVRPYFKVKRYNENNELIGLCRLYFFTPKYVTGYDENMILTKDEIYELMSLFIEERSSFFTERPIISYWDWLISEANDIMYSCYDIKPIVPWTPIPNYISLLRK